MAGWKSQAIQSEIEALRRDDGSVYPEDIVKYAHENPDSVLHGMFEWDDKKAAVQHRLWQARVIIGKFLVSELNGERKLVSLKVERSFGGGYRDMKDVMRDKDLRRTLILEALDEFRHLSVKYEHLSELQPVCKAITNASKQLQLQLEPVKEVRKAAVVTKEVRASA